MNIPAENQDLQTLWRRERDSNPRYPFRYTRFRGARFQPLTHLSALTETRRQRPQSRPGNGNWTGIWCGCSGPHLAALGDFSRQARCVPPPPPTASHLPINARWDPYPRIPAPARSVTNSLCETSIQATFIGINHALCKVSRASQALPSTRRSRG